MSKLLPGTEYEVEVSRESMFLPEESLSKAFATLPPDPFVSRVDVEGITNSEAVLVVTIAHPGSATNTVYVQYRADDGQVWSKLPGFEANSAGIGRVKLSNLTPGTGYEVEASLGDKFIAEETEPASFKTLLPRVGDVTVRGISTSRATIDVTVLEPGQGTQTVHLRYRTNSERQSPWNTELAVSTVGDSTSFELTNLAPGVCYEVQASLDKDFMHGVVALTFSTAPLPSLGAVNVVSVSERSARIEVTVLDSGGGGVGVYLRYRDSQTRTWSAALHTVSFDDRVEFEVSGLEPETEYEVESSLDPDFEAALMQTFVTEKEVTRVAAVTLGRVTRSSAELTVELANTRGRSTVYVRYRSLEVSDWEPFRTVSNSSGVGRLVLNNLEPGTLYEVEASLEPDFLWPGTFYANFTTERGARLSAIRLENVTDTRAAAVATVERVEGSTPVHLRYRTYGAGNWSDRLTRNTASPTVSFSLTELLPGTAYEIEASLDLNFPPSKTMYQTFETDPAPEISSLRVSDIAESGARVLVNISRPQPRMTIYLRYRTEKDVAWSRTISKAASSRSASILFERLMPETNYEVQVSLDTDFQEAKTAFFTTEKREPSVSGMEVEDIAETSATISLSISDSPGSVTVYLRYRKVGSSRWIKPASRTATTSNITFELDYLTENTSYEIEASLEGNFPVGSRVQDTFTTRATPRVSDVLVEEVTETDAWLSIGLSGSSGTNEALHIRYRELPDGEWQGGRIQVEDAETMVLISNLLPDTEYEIETSVGEAFNKAHTKSKKFKTIAREPAVVPTARPSVSTADAAPREFSFAMPENTSSPDGGRLSIWSSTPSAGMEVAIEEDLAWLFVEPEAGMAVKPGELLIVELRVDASGLGAGVYTGEIEIIGNADNLPLRIPITLTIASPTPTSEPFIGPTPTPVSTPLPRPTFMPEPTPLPIATPTSAPLESPSPSPSSVPAPGELSTPTMLPVPTIPLDDQPASEATPSPLPTPTPTPAVIMEGDDGLPAFTISMLVLAAVCTLVVGFFVIRRSVSK